MVEKTVIYAGKYKRLDRIGEGGQAIAYLVERIPDGLRLIAKVNKSRSTFAIARDEAERLSGFNSRYITKYYDSFTRETEDGEDFIIITEYCEGKAISLTFFRRGSLKVCHSSWRKRGKPAHLLQDHHMHS